MVLKGLPVTIRPSTLHRPDLARARARANREIRDVLVRCPALRQRERVELRTGISPELHLRDRLRHAVDPAGIAPRGADVQAGRESRESPRRRSPDGGGELRAGDRDADPLLRGAERPAASARARACAERTTATGTISPPAMRAKVPETFEEKLAQLEELRFQASHSASEDAVAKQHARGKMTGPRAGREAARPRLVQGARHVRARTGPTSSRWTRSGRGATPW